MSKRSKFVLVAILSGVLLWLTELASIDYRLGLVLAVCGAVYALVVWVLFDDLKGIEWLTLMILPVTYTFGSGLFASFLPAAVPSMFGRTFSLETSMFLSSLLRGVYYILYMIGMYGILLVENIFSVASIRTIQLFRAARSANFVFTLITLLFFFTIFLSLKLPFFVVMIVSFVISCTLAYVNYWSVDLKNPDYKQISRFTLATAWLTALIAGALCFWPIKPFIGGLLTTSGIYAMMGVLEQRLSNRIYLEGLMEYLISFVIIFLVAFFTTSWTG